MIAAERFIANKADDFEGWLRARRQGVTATQVANASTPAGFERIAAEFLTEWSEPDNRYMTFGRDWEGHIADYVEAEYGVAPNEWLICGDDPRHLATPDGLSADGRMCAEYKTTGKDWETIERLPLRYKRQVQWQLHVTGCEFAVVAWLLRSEVDGVMVPAWFTPNVGIVQRDEDMIGELVETANKLWAFVQGVD
jgi:hypothetical protein